MLKQSTLTNDRYSSKKMLEEKKQHWINNTYVNVVGKTAMVKLQL